jgi:hypothetical protein
MRALTCLLAVSLAVILLAAALAGPSAARVRSADMYCWVPDAEFPVACDEEDD